MAVGWACRWARFNPRLDFARRISYSRRSRRILGNGLGRKVTCFGVFVHALTGRALKVHFGFESEHTQVCPFVRAHGPCSKKDRGSTNISMITMPHPRHRTSRRTFLRIRPLFACVHPVLVRPSVSLLFFLSPCFLSPCFLSPCFLSPSVPLTIHPLMAAQAAFAAEKDDVPEKHVLHGCRCSPRVQRLG